MLFIKCSEAEVKPPSAFYFASEPQKRKSPSGIYRKGFFCFWGTRNRGRTDISVKILVFETSASTNSAIRAFPVLKQDGKARFCFAILQYFGVFFRNIIGHFQSWVSDFLS
jgi:hypothetical protein